jgi:hypothetical protein
MSRLLSCVVLTLAIVVGGCGPRELPKLKVYKTSGTLTVRGKPGKGLDVILRPIEKTAADSRRLVRGAVADDGTYQIGTYAGDDGAPEGTYKVEIVLSSAGQTEKPKADLSELVQAAQLYLPTVTIKPQDGNVIDPIDVKKP